MNKQFVLRRANLLDANALSQLYEKTFRETFVEDFSIPYPEKTLTDFFSSSASPESFIQSLNNSQEAIWVIENRSTNELIAFAQVGPCDTEHIPHADVSSNQDGLINRFYILRHCRSHGFGRELMSTVLSWLEEHFSSRPIWLCVWSENFKAQKFYSHYGFTKVGEFYYSVGEWKDKEFIMKRESTTLS